MFRRSTATRWGWSAHHGMKEVFGCARMVLGPIPKLPDDEIFGVTTFELG